MNKLTPIISLFFIYFSPCDFATVEEARAELDILRESSEQHLTAAATNHTLMSNEVDYTSLWAKEHGLAEIQKKSDKFLSKLRAEKSKTHRCRGSRENAIKHFERTNSEELLLCIEDQANESVNGIFKMKTALADYVSKAIHDEEKNIIACGQFDTMCLDRVVADIRDKIDAVAVVVEDEITINRYATEVQLDLIKDCAYQSISNAQLSLETISSCLY